MSGFVDIAGASGTQYRFRSAGIDDLPTSGGNALVISGGAEPGKVLVCVATNSLVQASSAIKAAVTANPGARTFIRLNVASAIREAEHADLVEAVRPDQVLDDFS
ncbi:hypothetical protein [Phenylobacterium sp.]|uniref:hypothetical protein n=1 Tax=Phenylobacterium sp. TaxID=1871053 RepID=UPI003BA86230